MSDTLQISSSTNSQAAMRDILIFLIVMGGIPFIVRSPALGIGYWVWLSLMNPHRAAWGFAYSFPFAYTVAIATIIGLFLSKEPRQLKGGAAVWVMIAFMAWMCVTTAFALEPDRALEMLQRVIKILFVTVLALFTLYKREHVWWLMLIIVLSIGFYGVKGGLFTLVTGGENLVWGPPETFIADNNALALAVIMTIPLLAYFYIMSTKRWVRIAILLSIPLCAVAVLGSYSRGGLLAIVAMSGFLWLKSKSKVWLGSVVVILAIGFLSFMPPAWEQRMNTIGTYEQDESSQGRIATWTMLTNLALDRPLVGGGFEPYSHQVFSRYLPDYEVPRAAHSVYFQVLGEHGFVGLALFVLFWLLTWRLSRRIIKHTRDDADARWAYWLAKMVQVSLVGYFVGGMFLNLAYWDMPYFLMVALAVTWHVVRNRVPDLSARQPDRSPPRLPSPSPLASS
ncbi:MAG: putative O-glycosylation ligase, exosortase A system-associated [Pseudomonadota bacterium]|nr:putative O-glycosylation ligase, exosortase A system-associated [Pseudomonadota bacterium]